MSETQDRRIRCACSGPVSHDSDAAATEKGERVV